MRIMAKLDCNSSDLSAALIAYLTESYPNRWRIKPHYLSYFIKGRKDQKITQIDSSNSDSLAYELDFLLRSAYSAPEGCSLTVKFDQSETDASSTSSLLIMAHKQSSDPSGRQFLYYYLLEGEQ